MQKNDEQLIKQFMALGKENIADNGFTERVMQHLPKQHLILARIWTFCGFSMATILFFMLDGVQTVFQNLIRILQPIANSPILSSEIDIDVRSIVAVIGVILYLSCRKIASCA